LNTITSFTCLKLDNWWHHKGKISKLQAFEIETADDSGIRPKAVHELAIRQVGGPFNLSYTRRDRKNYLQSKRQRELAFR
jgi:zinc finger SWIM domain-containing protein 3